MVMNQRSRQRSGSHGVKNYQHQRQTSLLGMLLHLLILIFNDLYLSAASEQRRKMRRSNVASNESFETDKPLNHHGSASDKKSRSSKAKSLSSSNRTSLSRKD